MVPIVLAALFWRGSTKWGALAVTLWTGGTVAATAVFQAVVAPGATSVPVWTIGGVDLITRTPGGTAVLGFMPVVPMTIISALLMFGVSAVTRKPNDTTLARYFSS
jgi:Na+/proline symporter